MNMPMTRLDDRTETVLGFSLTALYDQVQADEPLFGTASVVHPAHAALYEAEVEASAQHLALTRLAIRPGRINERRLDQLDAAMERVEVAVERRDRREARLARLLDTLAAQPADSRSVGRAASSSSRETS